jgi:hypothetical protein
VYGSPIIKGFIIDINGYMIEFFIEKLGEYFVIFLADAGK